jgi:DNA-binding XRE family transcriptional regulator
MAKKTRRDRAYPTGDVRLNWREDPAHLKEWRETLGVSQPELAKEAGVSKTLIALIEKGQRPLVQASRDAIWDAMYGFMVEQVKNPTSNAFKFWASFFGPLNTGILMGLEQTPAQRVRGYARQMEHDYKHRIDELTASDRQARDNNRFLLDLLDRHAEDTDAADRVEQIRAETKQQEREKAK